jgi:hypothetical protein
MVEFHSWEITSPSVLTRHNDLIQDGNLSDLRLLQDVYRRFPIPQDRRPTLDQSLILHLGLQFPLTGEIILYMARREEILVLMAPAYRDRELARANSVFADLP